MGIACSEQGVRRGSGDVLRGVRSRGRTLDSGLGRFRSSSGRRAGPLGTGKDGAIARADGGSPHSWQDRLGRSGVRRVAEAVIPSPQAVEDRRPARTFR